jgi:hypothetical protein
MSMAWEVSVCATLTRRVAADTSAAAQQALESTFTSWLTICISLSSEEEKRRCRLQILRDPGGGRNRNGSPERTVAAADREHSRAQDRAGGGRQSGEMYPVAVGKKSTPSPSGSFHIASHV